MTGIEFSYWGLVAGFGLLLAAFCETVLGRLASFLLMLGLGYAFAVAGGMLSWPS